MYKCTLQSRRITYLLLEFYNIIIREGYCLNFWLNILNIIIEKEKRAYYRQVEEYIINRSGFTASYKNLYRIKSEKIIENVDRLSKANYRSRKNYSVELVILEKCLIYESSLLSNALSIHNLTNLQSYYNRQLVNIGSIIKESVGKNKKAMKLFIKTMPVWYYYICTGYCISNVYYRGQNTPQAGTGQGNKFLGNMC